jgi:periplasmic divalent cation tolerance protein
MPTPNYLVLCTCPSLEVAEELARLLVESELAACANIVPGLTSVFSWQGEIEREAEVLLLIKTHQSVYPALEQRLAAAHPYELPEILAVSVEAGLAGYLRWIEANVTAEP